MKFKRRKAIAQKKLEDEKQNLIRVSGYFVRAGKTGRTVGTAVGGGEGVSASAGRAALPGRQPVFGRIGGIEAQIREVEQKEIILTGDQESVRAESETSEIGVRIARNRSWRSLDAAIASGSVRRDQPNKTWRRSGDRSGRPDRGISESRSGRSR